MTMARRLASSPASASLLVSSASSRRRAMADGTRRPGREKRMEGGTRAASTRWGKVGEGSAFVDGALAMIGLLSGCPKLRAVSRLNSVKRGCGAYRHKPLERRRHSYSPQRLRDVVHRHCRRRPCCGAPTFGISLSPSNSVAFVSSAVIPVSLHLCPGTVPRCLGILAFHLRIVIPYYWLVLGSCDVLFRALHSYYAC